MQSNISEMLAWNEKTVRATQIFLRENILNKKIITQGEAAIRLGIDESSFSRWLNSQGRKWDYLSPDQYMKLVGLIYEKRLVDPDKSAFLGKEISEFLSLGTAYTEHDRYRLEGVYVVYRFSYLVKGSILRGQLEIALDDEFGVFRTKEMYRIPAEVSEKIGEDVMAQDTYFPRSGFFIPRIQNNFLMISRKVEQNPAETQTIYFSDVFNVGAGKHREQVNSMYGVLSDWHGRAFYTTRVAVQRLPNDKPLEPEQITVIPVASLNPTVAQHLTEGIDVRKGIISYR